jgi:hypothetical protein
VTTTRCTKVCAASAGDVEGLRPNARKQTHGIGFATTISAATSSPSMKQNAALCF